MIQRPLIAGLLATFVLAGCATMNPHPPVPAPIAETMPKPPVSAEPMRWRPGYWNWTGSAYSWTPGQFVPAAGAGEKWMPGFWSQTGGGWTWNPPHWTM